MKVSALNTRNNFVPNGAFSNSTLEDPLIHADLLKPFEESARERGLLGMSSFDGFYPLWFHYEQERNVQLWSHGLSLSDLHKVRFWVDPLAIIAKVVGTKTQQENPFHSPGSLLGASEHYDGDETLRYYETLKALYESAIPHLHALSKVGSQVMADLESEENEKLDLVLQVRATYRESS